MPTTLYRKALEGFLTKKIDWVADDIRGVLIDTAAYGVAISGITFSGGQATVTTSSAHGLATNDPVVLTAVVGTAGLNSEFASVEVLSATQFRFPFVASSPTYTGGGRLVKIGADTFLSDIPAGARIATTSALSGKTATNGTARAATAIFANPSGTSCEAYALYQDTGSAATSRLILYCDDATGFPVTPTGAAVNVDFSSGTYGIFTL